MAQQKLVATADIVLPEGMDVFAGAEHAKGAKTVLEQAAKEIAKTFPGFAFSYTVANYRVPGAPTPGRRSAAQIAADKVAADAAAAAAAKAAPNGGAPATA